MIFETKLINFLNCYGKLFKKFYGCNFTLNLVKYLLNIIKYFVYYYKYNFRYNLLKKKIIYAFASFDNILQILHTSYSVRT